MVNGKDFGNTLLGGQKEDTIVTNGFHIEGHLLRWEDVVIQISNISMISAQYLSPPTFPFWSAIVVLLGFWLFTVNTLLALIVLVLGIGVIAFWYIQYKNVSSEKYLHILLNSGTTFSLVMRDIRFANEVLDVFARIFKDGGKPGVNYYIDLKGCRIDNNSSVIKNNH